jgi:acyl carrier protein
MARGNKQLIEEVAQLVLSACDVRDVEASQLDADSPIFGADSLLGLDSLDALEIIFAVQKTYGLRIDDRNTGRQVLQTIGSLCEFIEANRATDADAAAGDEPEREPLPHKTV